MNRYRVLRYFAYTIEILVSFMIQQTPGLLPGVFSARPVLLIPAAVSIAMFESAPVGMGFGVFCGLLLDFGIGSVLGFHGLLLGVIGYAVGVLAADLMRTNFLTSLLLAFASLTLVLFLQWFFYFVLYGYPHSGYALAAHYLPRLAYSFLFTPVYYYFNRALALQISEKE